MVNLTVNVRVPVLQLIRSKMIESETSCGNQTGFSFMPQTVDTMKFNCSGGEGKRDHRTHMVFLTAIESVRQMQAYSVHIN